MTELSNTPCYEKRRDNRYQHVPKRCLGPCAEKILAQEPDTGPRSLRWKSERRSLISLAVPVSLEVVSSRHVLGIEKRVIWACWEGNIDYAVIERIYWSTQ